MDVTKPSEFIGFGAMDVTKPYEFIGFGAMDVTKPYEFIGFGRIFLFRAIAQGSQAGPRTIAPRLPEGFPAKPETLSRVLIRY